MRPCNIFRTEIDKETKALTRITVHENCLFHKFINDEDMIAKPYIAAICELPNGFIVRARCENIQFMDAIESPRKTITVTDGYYISGAIGDEL